MSRGALVIVSDSCAGVSLAIAARQIERGRQTLLRGEESDLPCHRPLSPRLAFTPEIVVDNSVDVLALANAAKEGGVSLGDASLQWKQ